MITEEIVDLYAILGVKKDSTDKELKVAYRGLSKVHHPDVSKEPDAKEKFQQIVDAYEVLTDPDKRKEYDDFVKQETERIKEKSFEAVFNFFHDRKPGAHQGVKGEDLMLTIKFYAEEVKQGVTKQSTYEKYVNCEICDGHGFKRLPVNVCPVCTGFGYKLVDTKSPFGSIKVQKDCTSCNRTGYINCPPCESCHGKGKSLKEVSVEYSLPRDTSDGKRLILRGHGDAGYNGGRTGDLIITLKHAPEDKYEINGYDLSRWVDVSFLISLTGGNLKVTAPSGEKIKVPVPKRIQTGHLVKLDGEGLFNPETNVCGDLYLKLNIKPPYPLSDSQAEKFISILSRGEGNAGK
jgi:molecular chaperone DnaJ